jgi:hypothetical protein
VPGDTNDCRDIFVHDRGEAAPSIVHADVANGTGVETGTQWAPFDTMEEAIEVVAGGGTVKAARGTYAEVLSISGKMVIIKGGYPGGTYPGTGDFSEASRDPLTSPTIIDGGGSPVQIVCQDPAARGSTLDGLTLRNGGAIFRGGLVLKRVIALMGAAQ